MCDCFFGIFYHAFTLEVLNLVVQACVIKVVRVVIGFGDSIEKDNNTFDVGASM
jgi:hypothetical protein